MTKFQHSIEVREQVEWLKLEGVLDEDSELDSIGARLAENMVVVDLGDVERVNVGGAKAWWGFVEACDSRGATLRVSRCSAAMVAQLNLHDSNSVSVERLALPYFCPECDEPRTLWVTASDLGSAPIESPVRRCETCDLVMQFDDGPSYFEFLGAGHGELEASNSSKHDAPPSEPSDMLKTEPGSSPLVWVAIAAIVVVIMVAAFILAD